MNQKMIVTVLYKDGGSELYKDVYEVRTLKDYQRVYIRSERKNTYDTGTYEIDLKKIKDINIAIIGE